jgi:predicted RNA-binding Zn-ribbon protein involved in translation (DUF1610 family)
MKYPKAGFYCTTCGSLVDEQYIDKCCPHCGGAVFRELTNEDLFEYYKEEEENDVD